MLEREIEKGTGTERIKSRELNSKEIQKGSSTNIVVLTNKCNFNCTYCFEQKRIRAEEEFIISKEKIIEIIDRIYHDNPQNSCIVLFGGEPLLAFDEIEFLMNYTLKYSKNSFFTMNTNGYRFKNSKFFDRYINNPFVRNRRLIPEISFDGIGNFSRVTKSGKNTTNDMIDILQKFRNYNTPFRVSYTIHSGNESNLAEDIQNIIKVFRPERVIINKAYNSIKNLENVERQLDQLMNFRLVPICPIHCSICNICRKATEKYKYYNIRNNEVFVKSSTDITGSPL